MGGARWTVPVAAERGLPQGSVQHGCGGTMSDPLWRTDYDRLANHNGDDETRTSKLHLRFWFGLLIDNLLQRLSCFGEVMRLWPRRISWNLSFVFWAHFRHAPAYPVTELLPIGVLKAQTGSRRVGKNVRSWKHDNVMPGSERSWEV